MITPQLYALFLCRRNTTNRKKSIVVPTTHASTTFLNSNYTIISLISQSKHQESEDKPLQVEAQYPNNLHSISPRLPQSTITVTPSISISS